MAKGRDFPDKKTSRSVLTTVYANYIGPSVMTDAN